MIKSIYIIGSLRNPQVPRVAGQLTAAGFEAFDEWYAAGPEADDCWQAYEKQRGHTFKRALEGAHAQDVYHFDRRHLTRCDAAVMVMPAGKSCHIEIGFVSGQNKPTFILLDQEPERYDVMYNFATVVYSVPELITELDHC